MEVARGYTLIVGCGVIDVMGGGGYPQRSRGRGRSYGLCAGGKCGTVTYKRGTVRHNGSA